MYDLGCRCCTLHECCSLVSFVLFAVSSLQTMNGVQQLCLGGPGVLW